jgi:hypothetical protein
MTDVPTQSPEPIESVHRYEAHMQRLMDITRESNFALWNSLLTLDGIVASVFSAVAVFEGKIRLIEFLIIVLSMLSAFLLIWNFRCTRDLYRTIGRTDPEVILRMSPEEKRLQVEGAAKQHDACNRREAWTFVALGVQALAMLALLPWKR